MTATATGHLRRLDDEFLDRLAEFGPIGKTLGMLIRPSFVAAEGKVFVWGDWSAIEARVLPWLANSRGGERKLDIFRRSDADPKAPDIYEITAGELLGVDPKDVTKPQRQSHGKVPELSLGFGGAVGALQKMAINYGVYFDEEASRALVSSWRDRNRWARDFWGRFQTDRQGEVIEATGLWGAANLALRNPGQGFPAGRVTYYFEPDYLDGTLFCMLPCGRPLAYPTCRYRTRTVKDKETGEEEQVHALWYRKGYGWSTLWYGKLAENVTQAAAGSILREMLVDLDRQHEWMPIVGHTHDEIVTECDARETVIERAKHHLKDRMLYAPEWRKTLPLAVEVTSSWYYTKDPFVEG